MERLRRLVRALKPDPLEVTDGRMFAEWHAVVGLGRVLGTDHAREARLRHDRDLRRRA
jgi:hypothetical protein